MADAARASRWLRPFLILTTSTSALVVIALTIVVPVRPAIGSPFVDGRLDPSVVGIAVWCLLGLVGSTRNPRTRSGLVLDLSTAAAIAAGALGGPTAAAWVALLGSTELRELKGEVPWYGTLASHGCMALGAVAGTVALGLVRGVAGPSPLGLLLAAGAGIATVAMVDTLLGAILFVLRTGVSPRELFAIAAPTLALHLVVSTSLAWASAELYLVLAWWAPFVLAAPIFAVAAAADAERERYDAEHDALTGLANRRQLDRRLAHLAGRTVPTPATVLVIDLDGFKAVNDALGHEAGDTVLQTVAGRLRSVLRPGDVVARPGGDEFVVLIEGVPEATAIDRLRDRIVESVGRPIEVGTAVVTVGASIGAASSDDIRGEIGRLTAQADEAMFATKERRRTGLEPASQVTSDAA